MNIPLLKNSADKKSVSFTMMIIAFSTVTLWLLASIIENIGILVFRPFDASDAMLYLTPILGLYFGRRWLDKTGSGEQKTDPIETVKKITDTATKEVKK